MRYPSTPPGSLWCIVPNPYDHYSSVPLLGRIDKDESPVAQLETGTIVIVIGTTQDGITKNKKDRWVQVLSPIGPGFIHIDWWRKYDCEPALLSWIE